MNTSIFPQVCQQSSLPKPVPEYRFGAMHSGGPGKGLRERLKASGLSDWRFDWAWPDEKVALEVEGGLFNGGFHAHPTGIRRDMAKYNAAGARGWIVLRCLPEELLRASTLELVRAAIATRKAA